ncbi:MAG: sulfotransferase domain-containing protein [Halioglobus sp.]|nr:sulfotransferase domain-containing protein [Halioglobus sp.]
MNAHLVAINTYRKVVRRLNWGGYFIETGSHPLPWAVLAGYTRSGTTFLGRLLSNVLRARPIHEPLNPSSSREMSFFNPRESRTTIEKNTIYQQAILASFSEGFIGSKYTNTGSRLFYDGRIVKIVRGNHYLDYLSDMLHQCPFIVLMRNPNACIASRIKSDWPVPDHSHSYSDIEPLLTAEQAKFYRIGGSKAFRLAVSWSLDNLMLLKNSDRENFIFVHYENLITQPYTEIKKILMSIGKSEHAGRISRELALENIDKPKEDYVNRWKTSLSNQQQEEIELVLQTFNLHHYYDQTDGIPLNAKPF